jgi:hypothetical protein
MSAATPESLIRDAHLLMQACGIHRSPSWAARTVRTFVQSSVHGLPFGDYLAARLQLNAQQRADLLARSEFARVISYADPTGETAVRNVMKESPR